MTIAEVIHKLNQEEPRVSERRVRISQEPQGLPLFECSVLRRVINGGEFHPVETKSRREVWNGAIEIAKGFSGFRENVVNILGENNKPETSFLVMLYAAGIIIGNDIACVEIINNPDNLSEASNAYRALAVDFDDTFDPDPKLRASGAWLMKGHLGKSPKEVFDKSFQMLQQLGVDEKYLEKLQAAQKNYLLIEQQLRDRSGKLTQQSVQAQPVEALIETIQLKDRCFGDLAVALVNVVTNKDLDTESERKLRMAVMLTTIMDASRDERLDKISSISIRELSKRIESSYLVNGNGRRHNGVETLKRIENYCASKLDPSLALALRVGFNTALIKEVVDKFFK